MSKGNIEIRSPAATITEADVVKASFGIVFRGFEGFKEFYLRNNGGKSDKSVIITDKEESSSIRYFLSIKYRFHPKVSTLEQTNVLYRSRDDGKFFYDKLIFATDDGGNPTCVHLPSGEILFVPIDSGPDLENEKWHLADKFSDFLGKLTLFEEE